VTEPVHSSIVREGQCAQPSICPLSRVQAGTVVCIKQLSVPVEVRERLREMGFGEEQKIKLLSSNGSLVCQVCNARLGISAKLGDAILVEPLPNRLKAA
jgi:Fe2+ transport system protein FeoA